jgi:hypothetical protein
MSQPAFRRSRAALLSCLVLAVVVLGLAACAPRPAPTPDVQELARAIAAVWATETAQAAAVAATTPDAVPVTTTVATAVPPAAATVTATLAVTPTVPPTSTATASPTLAPTLTLVPTSTPRPTTDSPVVCDIPIDTELEAAWTWEVLGCPVADAQTVWAAWEPFQRGYMLWRNDLDTVYALLHAGGADPGQGPVLTGGSAWAWDGSNPEGRGLTPPAGSLEPVRGFGRVWSEFLGGPTGQLGWATQPERGICVTLQSFESGVIFKSDNTVRQCEDTLLNMASEPGFTPVFVSVQDDAWWRSH